MVPPDKLLLCVLTLEPLHKLVKQLVRISFGAFSVVLPEIPIVYGNSLILKVQNAQRGERMSHMSQRAPQVEIGLTVAAVARRIGIAPATLRTWDRRYGVGPSVHVAGSHRRYSGADVARIDLMRKLMLNGVLPSVAAKSALSQEVVPENIGPEHSSSPALHAVSSSDSQPDNVISLDGPKTIIRSLNRAATALDATGCDQIISNSLASHGVVWTWENVLMPVLIALGEKWEQTGEGVEQEHLIAETVTGLFRNLANSVTEPVNARPVLLACAPHELHTIPMYAIAAGLAEQNVSARILGARMPADALANAAKKIGPCAIVVWSQTQGTADITVWEAVEPMRPAPLLMSVGPGWQPDLPAGVVKPHDFASTLIALAAASGR